MDKGNKLEPSSELLQRIKKQIEFYFGDANMKRDAFLIRQTKLDDGWVPMTIMLRFRMLAQMSRDVDVILLALESSDLIEISDDRMKIRRSTRKPVASDNGLYSKTEQKQRTIYVQGFSRQTDVAVLIRHFETVHPVEHIFLKKEINSWGEYNFDGSLYLQFKTLCDAKNFMSESSSTYDGKILTKTWAPASYTVGKV